MVCDGNGYLEIGNLALAEKSFKEAYEDGIKFNNLFLQVHALGGLFEVCSRRKDKVKARKALADFLEAVDRLPTKPNEAQITEVVKYLRKMLQATPDDFAPGEISKRILKSNIGKTHTISKSALRDEVKNTMGYLPILRGGK